MNREEEVRQEVVLLRVQKARIRTHHLHSLAGNVSNRGQHSLVGGEHIYTRRFDDWRNLGFGAPPIWLHIKS